MLAYLPPSSGGNRGLFIIDCPKGKPADVGGSPLRVRLGIPKTLVPVPTHGAGLLHRERTTDSQ